MTSIVLFNLILGLHTCLLSGRISLGDQLQ